MTTACGVFGWDHFALLRCRSPCHIRNNTSLQASFCCHHLKRHLKWQCFYFRLQTETFSFGPRMCSKAAGWCCRSFGMEAEVLRFIRYDRSRQHWKFRVKGQKALCLTGPLPLWRQFNDTATLVVSLKLPLCYFVFYELFSFTFLLLLSFLYSSVVFSETRLPAAVALKMSLWDYFQSRWKNETLKQIL